MQGEQLVWASRRREATGKPWREISRACKNVRAICKTLSFSAIRIGQGRLLKQLLSLADDGALSFCRDDAVSATVPYAFGLLPVDRKRRRKKKVCRFFGTLKRRPLMERRRSDC